MPQQTIRKALIGDCKHNGDSATLGLRLENALLRKQVEDLQKQVRIDPLTGLGNRRKMEESLREHVTSLTRIKKPLAIVMVDLDDLKKINDTKSHLEGDQALKTVARVLKKCARQVDVVCRIGGDEFVVILPYTNDTGAISFIDRMDKIMGKEKDHIRASTGIATISGLIVSDQISQSIKYILKTADKRMYEIKQSRKAQRIIRPIDA
jgi:diguanylate cyclase (GGDEF)-like protein